MSSAYDEWLKRTGISGVPLQPPDRIDAIIKHLRDTLTDEMATRAFRMRFKREPNIAELASFREKLIDDHYEEGFDRWVEKYLYIDPDN